MSTPHEQPLEVTYDSEEAERQDVEQLCYLGLRAAFGTRVARRRLRSQARACADRKFRHHNLWAVAREFPPVRLNGIEHLHEALAQGRGAIVCTPHVGFYQRIPLALVEARLPVTMLLDTANFERERSKLTYWERRFAGQVPMKYINAELPNAAWEMARDLRAGRILFIWLDGNSGLARTAQATTVVPVSFCGVRILVRKGLAHLSAWTGAPVVHALAAPYRRKASEISFEPPLSRRPDEAAGDYCQRVLQHLYTLLEARVRRDPACWEEWYHLPLWQVRETPSGTLSVALAGDEAEAVLEFVLRVDEESIDYLKLVQGTVVTSLRTGETLLVTEPLRALLDAFDGRRRLGAVLDKLATRYDEVLLLNALHALCAGGFLVVAGGATDPEQSSPEP